MILDTNAVSALACEDKALMRLLANSERHHLPVVVLGEFRFGISGSRHRAALQKWIQRLEEESVVLSMDAETAKHYAAIRRALKEAGKPILGNDLWIAALALQHDQRVISRDVHFDFVKGVKRIQW